jgi:hypothetical protein
MMPRETIQAKGRRYLTEGRLLVLEIGPAVVRAICRSSSRPGRRLAREVKNAVDRRRRANLYGRCDCGARSDRLRRDAAACCTPPSIMSTTARPPMLRWSSCSPSTGSRPDEPRPLLSTGYAPRAMHVHWTWTLDGPAVVSLALSAVAALFAGWTGLASHRAARSAAQAVSLERDRRHSELAPHISLEHGGTLGGEDEGVWFANDGPSDLDRIGFTFVQTTSRPPVDGLLTAGEWTTAGEVGPLALGDRRLLRCRRAADGEDSILRLRITCRNDLGIWSFLGQVEIPGIPFVGALWGR